MCVCVYTHTALARALAAESIVLLQNEGHALPLSNDAEEALRLVSIYLYVYLYMYIYMYAYIYPLTLRSRPLAADGLTHMYVCVRVNCQNPAVGM